jgi:hypothetical protein
MLGAHVLLTLIQIFGSLYLLGWKGWLCVRFRAFKGVTMRIEIDFDTEQFGKGNIGVEIPLALLEFPQQSSLLQAEMIGVVAQAIASLNDKRKNDDKEEEDEHSIKDICDSHSRVYRKNIDEIALMS